MKRCLSCAFKRFRESEKGSVVVEFVIWFPIFVALMVSSVELGLITARNTMLESALDQVVRDIRLGTGAIPQHDAIKNQICTLAAILPNCSSNLRLEMRKEDLRNWSGIPKTADCTDRSEDVTEPRSFTPGRENELMVLRACAKFPPLIPTSRLGQTLAKDGSGDIALTATSAFVQEPE